MAITVFTRATTGPYRDAAISNPQPHILFNNRFNIILTPTPVSPK